MVDSIEKGADILYRPKNGGEFPTGESTREATVEAIRGEDIIIRQPDGFTQRISEEQIVD